MYFLPVCASTQVTALVFVKILKRSLKTTCLWMSPKMFPIKSNDLHQTFALLK